MNESSASRKNVRFCLYYINNEMKLKSNSMAVKREDTLLNIHRREGKEERMRRGNEKRRKGNSAGRRRGDGTESEPRLNFVRFFSTTRLGFPEKERKMMAMFLLAGHKRQVSLR